MSCYNWEEGTIRLPSAVYAKFRKTFVESVRVREALDFEEAAKLIEAIRTKKIQLPPLTSLTDQVQEVLELKSSVRPSGRQWVLPLWKIAEVVTHDTAPVDPAKPASQPQRVARKSVKALRKTMLSLHTSKSRSFSNDDASVVFNDEHRTVRWVVRENNRAVERARDSFLGVTLFAMLDKVEWTRASGGTIAGNDEYTRENRGAGGGSNYVTSSFGPELKKARDSLGRVGLVRSFQPYY
jgi:hypothetical protein